VSCQIRSKNRNSRSRRTVAVVRSTRVVRSRANPGPTQPRRRRRRNRPNRIQTVQPACLGRINPFLSEVAGARSPDDFGYPSGTAVCRNSFSQTALSTANAAGAILPFVNNYLYGPANITAGTITWTGGNPNAMAQLGPINNISSAVRFVAWGARFTTESSLTATTGHIWVCHVPINITTQAPYFDFPTTESQIASMPLAEKYSMVELSERPLIVPARAFDDGIYRFRTVSSNEATATGVGLESTLGWCAIVYMLVGVPTAVPIINVEVIHHIEYLQDGSTLYNFLDMLPGDYEPQVMEKCSRVDAAKPVAIIETAIDTAEKATASVESFLLKGARIAAAGYRAYSAIASLTRGYRSVTAAPNAPMLEYKNDYY
jgi:hypothetical protein